MDNYPSSVTRMICEERQRESRVRENFMHGLVHGVSARRTGHTTLRRAFTLVELLVVIAIIALLASLLFPALGKARGLARSSQCLNNLKQTGIVFLNYLDDNNEYVHPCIGWGQWWPDLATNRALSYLDNPKLLLCPSEEKNVKIWSDYPKYGTNYGYNVQMGQMGFKPVPRLNTIKKASQCFVMADATDYTAAWYKLDIMANAISIMPDLAYSESARQTAQRHLGKTNLLYVDGHAQGAPVKPHGATAWGLTIWLPWSL